MKLYFHPRSPFSQKVVMALHEKDISYTPVLVNLGDAAARAEFQKLTPIGKVPLLVLDNEWKIPESSIIVEYLDTHHHGGPRLIPEDRDLARQTRFHDRLADLYTTEPMLKILFDAEKPEVERDPAGVAAARARLDAMFTGFDRHLGNGRTWLMGDGFTMADCALLPVLGYCRTYHPFERWTNLAAYAGRGFERPSYRLVQAELARFTARTAA